MFKQQYNKPDEFKTSKDKKEFYDRAYATFCVALVNKMKSELQIEETYQDTSYEEDNKTIEALTVSMELPFFKKKKGYIKLKHPKIEVNPPKAIKAKEV